MKKSLKIILVLLLIVNVAIGEVLSVQTTLATSTIKANKTQKLKPQIPKLDDQKLQNIIDEGYFEMPTNKLQDKLSPLTPEKARQDMIKYMNANRPSNDPLCLEPDKLSFAGKEAQKLAESGGQDLSSLLHTNYFPKTSTYGKTYGPYEVIKQDMKEQITCEPIVKEEHKCVGIGFKKEEQDTTKQVENIDKQIQSLNKQIQDLNKKLQDLEDNTTTLQKMTIDITEKSIADLQKKKADFQKFQGDKYAYWSQVFGKEDDCFCVYDKKDKRCEPNEKNKKETAKWEYDNNGSTKRDDPKGRSNWNKENGDDNPCYNPVNSQSGGSDELEDKKKQTRENYEDKMKKAGMNQKDINDRLAEYDENMKGIEDRLVNRGIQNGDLNAELEKMNSIHDDINNILNGNSPHKLDYVGQGVAEVNNPYTIKQRGPTCVAATLAQGAAVDGKAYFDMLENSVNGGNLDGLISSLTKIKNKDELAKFYGYTNAVASGDQIQLFNYDLYKKANGTFSTASTLGVQIGIDNYLSQFSGNIRPGLGMVGGDYGNYFNALGVSNNVFGGGAYNLFGFFIDGKPGHHITNEFAQRLGNGKYLYSDSNSRGLSIANNFFLSDRPLTDEEFANIMNRNLEQDIFNNNYYVGDNEICTDLAGCSIPQYARKGNKLPDGVKEILPDVDKNGNITKTAEQKVKELKKQNQKSFGDEDVKTQMENQKKDGKMCKK